jgi:hypothetical protein
VTSRDPRAEADALWDQALDLLRLRMSRATFDGLFRGTCVHSREGPEWVIDVASEYALAWLRNRMAKVVHWALQQVTGGPVEVRFVVGPRQGLPPAWDAEPEDEQDEPATAARAAAPGGRGRQAASAAGGTDMQWTDVYIRIKVAFRKQALRRLKGAKLSVFLCLALHLDRDGVAVPGGIEAIMRETGYSRGAVCSALGALESLGLIRKHRTHRGPDRYSVLGYAWFGRRPGPSLWESKK